MKFYVFVLLAFLAIPISHAAMIDWTTNIEINDDKTTEWTINQVYSEPITKTDYFILGDVTGYYVTGDDKQLSCTLTSGPGTLILCDKIHAKNITYYIKTQPLANDILQKFRLFTQKISVTQSTKSFSVTVKLPLGAGLVEWYRLQGTTLKPFEPETGKQGSDGRHIFITWKVDNPKLGDTLYISAVYEQFSEEIQFGLFGIIIAAIVAGFGIFIFISRQKTVHSILPVLTNSERKVIEILIKEKGEADQRNIVKETDFSKAQVSRIITDLVNRGVIEKISKGRKNIIRLNKAIRIGNTQTDETLKTKE